MKASQGWTYQMCLVAVMVTSTWPASQAQILTSINFKLREEQIKGYHVGNVGTVSGLSSILSETDFSRLKFHLSDSKYFQIDEKSGLLTTAVKLDREEVCPNQEVLCQLENQVIVYTRVGAGNYDLYKVITVTVDILDINDNAPEFPSGSVSLTIAESNDPDQVLMTNSARDRDTGDNAVKQYRFQDPTDKFRLAVHKNPDGTSYLGIIVKERLDREVKDLYQVVVVATDGGFPQRSGSVVINIQVTDINDHAPEFSSQSYNESVPEDTPLRVPIMKVVASDRDTGHNAELTYQFSSRVSSRIRQKFYLDQHTGEIFAQADLDYEEDKLFQFIVEAVDHGTPHLTSRTNVNLYVLDKNDNTPHIVINLPPTGTAIAENEPVGKFIAHVSILDGDSGLNAEISCSMNDENFSLTKFSEFASNRYKVVLAKPLDYEQQTFHRVIVTCTDAGNPPLSNSTSFVVSVLDVNDNRPAFSQSKYTETILENQEGNREFLEVTAHDWDSGDLGRVSYYLEDTPDRFFSIHPTSGVLTVLRTLDREYRPSYEFYVFTRDHGPEQLSASALVIIYVDDENDEPPRFLNPIYFGEVLENQPVGTIVAAAVALDNDSPANSRMSYSLVQQDEDFLYFSIDASTGLITTSTVFDREEKETYYLTIKVADPSKSSFFSFCNFTIRILDVNDHSPLIRLSPDENATYSIQHTAEVGSLITTVQAYDGDEIYPQTSGLTFYIESGDPQELFDLNRYTGSLTLTRMITASDLKTHQLVVVVQDGGQPPRFDSRQLSIVVNGTLEAPRQAGLGENMVITVIIVCVTVVFALVLVVVILVVRRCDRRRKRDRTNEKMSEEKMYQLSVPQHWALDDGGEVRSVYKKGRKERKPLGSHSSMLDQTGVTTGDQLANNLSRPHHDEESRLIDILKKNCDGELSESGDDTDPSDSGRGGSEDEAVHRGPALDPEANRHHPRHHIRGARPSADQRNNLYNQQKYSLARLIPQTSEDSTRDKPFRLSVTSQNSTNSSLPFDADTESSGKRLPLNRTDGDRTVSYGSRNQLSGIPESFGNASQPNSSYRSIERDPTKRLSDSSRNLPILRDSSGRGSLTHTRPASRVRDNSEATNQNKDRARSTTSGGTYAPQTRSYRYTDRTYPIPRRVNSPSICQPEDDDQTTTSGSYIVNPEELRPELEALVLHDTVV